VPVLRVHQRLQLKEEQARLSDQLDVLKARFGAVKHELDLLEQGLHSGGSLREGQLTDAVLAVLGEASGSLSPSEIKDRLDSAGRTEALNKLTATLHHLVSRGKVRRQERGKYIVT
jgi:hypothetical protein